MQKDISIIIPIYNDAPTIGKTIDELFRFFDVENLDGELIIVNDGGEEYGVRLVREKMKFIDSIKLIDRKKNRGKGYTVKEGVSKSSGKIIFYTDADLPYGTESIKQMYKRLINNESDLVLANRNLSGKDGMKQATLARKLTHVVYSIFVGSLVFDYSDTLAGLKGMTREVAEAVFPHLTIDRFSFDVEFILLAKKIGFKISELPVTLQQFGKSSLNIILDSPQMIKDVLKIAWRNRLGLYDIKKK